MNIKTILSKGHKKTDSVPDRAYKPECANPCSQPNLRASHFSEGLKLFDSPLIPCPSLGQHTSCSCEGSWDRLTQIQPALSHHSSEVGKAVCVYRNSSWTTHRDAKDREPSFLPGFDGELFSRHFPASKYSNALNGGLHLSFVMQVMNQLRWKNKH